MGDNIVEDNELFKSYLNNDVSNEELVDMFFKTQSMYVQKCFLFAILEKYRKKKKPIGRPKIQYDECKFSTLYLQWKCKKITAKKFMKEMGMQPNTFYRIVKQYENGKED